MQKNSEKFIQKQRSKRHPTAIVRYVTLPADLALAACCTQHLPKEYSKKVITSGGVWLNKKRRTNPDEIISKGSTLKIYLCPTQGYQYLFSKEFIIEETDDWVLVFKEPLVTTSMDRSNKYFNLMAGLNNYYHFNDMSHGVQPITRLDYQVAGLCLFSKKKHAERKLFTAMQHRQIKKRYLIAIPHSKLLRSTSTRFRVSNHLTYINKAKEDSTIGKKSTTWFVPSHQTDTLCFFHALSKTGRRHQIRYHASTTLGPLMNDWLYGNQYNRNHHTIGLIANQISFPWNKQKITISLPKKWINLWMTWVAWEGPLEKIRGGETLFQNDGPSTRKAN